MEKGLLKSVPFSQMKHKNNLPKKVGVERNL